MKRLLQIDGWHFIEFPITEKSPVKIYAPGENQWQWQRDGEFGNGQVDYPIRVTGLGVGNFPHALHILTMEPTVPVIKIKDLMVY
jgi:hypothetical protein